MSVSRQVARRALASAVKRITRPGLRRGAQPHKLAPTKLQLASRHILAQSVLTANDGRQTRVALHATKGRRAHYIGTQVAA
jgi:hypothetical protein